MVRSTRVAVFRVSFRRLALEGADGRWRWLGERRFGGVSPGVAFALATRVDLIKPFVPRRVEKYRQQQL